MTTRRAEVRIRKRLNRWRRMARHLGLLSALERQIALARSIARRKGFQRSR